jgi:hypothetical protein
VLAAGDFDMTVGIKETMNDVDQRPNE